MQVVVVTQIDETAAEVLEILRRLDFEDLRHVRSVAETLEILHRDAILVLDWDSPGVDMELIASVRDLHRYHDHGLLVLADAATSRQLPAEVRAQADILFKPLDAERFTAKIERLSRPYGESIRVDVNYVNPFIRATVRTFEMLCGIALARRDLFLKRDYRMFGDVSGVMGLSGMADGSVVISFPEDVAVRLVGRMIHEKLDSGLDSTIRDGVGELVNVIAGNAKAEFTNTPYHFNIGLPSVIVGAGHMIVHQAGTPCVVVVFGLEGGEMALQVCLAPGVEEE